MKRIKIIALVLTMAVLLLTAGVAFADGDGVNPITAISNLTNLLYLFITAVGVVFLILGGVQFGMALKEQDPARKSHAIMSMLGGLVLVGIRFIVQWIMEGV